MSEREGVESGRFAHMTPHDQFSVMDILRERMRQEQLRAEGRFAHTAADPEMSDTAFLAVLMEEVGEVARAINDAEGAKRLRDELVQVAAVCVARLELLGQQAAGT